VSMDYWMNLKLTEDQLHTNLEKICQILHAYFGKKEIHSKLKWTLPNLDRYSPLHLTITPYLQTQMQEQTDQYEDTKDKSND
jgi:hypothetical protein